MKKRFYGLTIALALTGCSTQRKPIAKELTTRIGTGLTFNYTQKSDTKYFITRYEAETDMAKKKALRNRMLFELIGMVDGEYNHFEVAMRSERVYKDALVKWASIGMTAGASLSGQTIANILAATDTALKGANEAFDKNVFGDRTPEFLLNSMRASRRKIEANIYSSMTNSPDVYPLEAGLRDVSRYYTEGFVTSAITRLTESTGDEAKKAEDAAVARKMEIK